MITEYYESIKNSEKVDKEESIEYMLEKLNITIVPSGKNGELTAEQIEMLIILRDNYFSSDWIEKTKIEVTFKEIFGEVNNEQFKFIYNNK
jgi:hypothetical protein